MEPDPADSIEAAQTVSAQSVDEISSQSINVFSLAWQPENWSFSIDLGIPLIAFLGAVALFAAVLRLVPFLSRSNVMEIDQAEIGVGDSKLSFRPNLTDRQVAYAIWVELSTRKIGLPIDLSDDVITEIYDSWYNYFSVTRELIKTVSVSKVRNRSTRQIINLSIDVLNNGLRPHLTRWQARYRHWYQQQVERIDKNSDEWTVLDPQGIQKKFPKYAELEDELLAVNAQLIAYRNAMQKLVFDLQKP